MFASSITVQSFVTIKWQEKKLLIIKILKFPASDDLKLIERGFQDPSSKLPNCLPDLMKKIRASYVRYLTNMKIASGRKSPIFIQFS